jgi:hypothetical protein
VSTPPVGGAEVEVVSTGAVEEVVVSPGVVVVVVVVEVVEVVVVVVGVWAHTGRVMVLVSNVTAPFRAIADPSMMAPVVRVTDVNAMMVPWKEEPVPSVAELPICQKTLQASEALMRFTLLAVAVTRVLAVWKTKTASGSPPASSVRRGVNAGRQGLATKLGGDGRNRSASGGVVVRRDQVGLGQLGDGIGDMERAVLCDRIEPGHRGTRMEAHVSGDRGGPGVGDGGTAQNREIAGRAEANGRFLRA